jgi:hypothetical protein
VLLTLTFQPIGVKRIACYRCRNIWPITMHTFVMGRGLSDSLCEWLCWLFVLSGYCVAVSLSP